MFDALRLAALIHNQAGTDFNQWVTPVQALNMATRNGARAFGLDAGVLAPGKLADLVLLRRDTPAFTPLNDVMSQLVFCENGSSVDTVIVNGEVVVGGGRLTRSRARGSAPSRACARLDPSIQRELAAARRWSLLWRKCIFRVFKEYEDTLGYHLCRSPLKFPNDI
jgi:adenine deaminase